MRHCHSPLRHCRVSGDQGVRSSADGGTGLTDEDGTPTLDLVAVRPSFTQPNSRGNTVIIAVI